MNLTAAEARRLGLIAKNPRKASQKGVQPPKQENEAYCLPRPAEATHKQVKALGHFGYTNPPLKGSWARELGRAFGYVEVCVYNNDNGHTLLLLRPEQWASWFQEIERTSE